MRWADGFIAVDWGTTNRRAYSIDEGGHSAQEFEDGKGVLSVPAGESARVLDALQGAKLRGRSLRLRRVG